MYWYDRCITDKSFTYFVDGVLRCLNDGPIDKFRLEFGPFMHAIDVESWLLKVISRQIQELDVVVDGLEPFPPLSLPEVVFRCETLVVLKLACHMLVKIPRSFCLPKLKTLYLNRVVYENRESVSALISNCLALEDLSVVRDPYDNVRVYRISSPSLKRLKINFVLGEPFFHNCGYGLAIDAPALQYLDLKDHLSEDIFIINLGSLTEAYLDIGLDCMSVLECFQALHAVKFLSLSHQTSMMVTSWRKDFSYVKFQHLTHLTLGVNPCDAHQLLPDFLPFTDNLEVLKLVEGQNWWGNWPQDFDSDVWKTSLWIGRQHVPRCLLTSLRSISIGEFRGQEDGLSMLKYLLKNGKALETFEISTSTELELEKKFGIFQMISKFPRGSQ